MKKSIKLISALLLIVMLVSTFSTICYGKDIVTDIGTKAEASEGADISKLKTTAGDILKTIRNIAAVVAVVIVAILGIKYMLGSVEEKAEYKKSFVPLIVGVIVVFAAVQIATMIVSIAD